MSIREPPPLATWLVKHFAAGYRTESLLGDLLEEYQAGRTPGWYWREAIAALLATAMRWARLLYQRRRVHGVLPRATQCAVFVGVVVLSQKHRDLCLAAPTLLTSSILLLICAAVAELAIALAVWLCCVWRPGRKARSSGLARRSIVAFTAIGLGTGALTWASTTSCPGELHACPSSSPTASCSQPDDRTADGR